MANYVSSLRLVFSQPVYAASFMLLLSIFVPIYALLTDIVTLDPFEINPNVRVPEAALTMLIAVLCSFGVTLAVYQLFEQGKVRSSKAGIWGSLLGAFASTCPVCAPFWLVWLGLGSVSVLLISYSIYIELASVAILIYSIKSGLDSINGCKIRKKSG